MRKHHYPIRLVYSERYTIPQFLTGMHPIIEDLTHRYHSIVSELDTMGSRKIYTPDEVDPAIIESITTREYRDKLKNPNTIIPCLYGVEEHQTDIAFAVVESIESMVMGTLKATQLSYAQGGLTINIGGGFHHARKDRCGGYSIYNDYLAAAQWIWDKNPAARILYIDLDAHFGDGVLEELGSDKRFYHYDVFNTFSDKGMIRTTGNCRIYGIPIHSSDSVYLGTIRETLEDAIDTVYPDFVFYNAGSDPLFGDELGQLGLSVRGLKLRDQYVFETIRKRNIPSIMTLSGGYTKRSVVAVTRSIQNLIISNRMFSD
jgi:acetoin utilization deacetylase AcuC-like enzyme